jgi:hypothetical protein
MIASFEAVDNRAIPADVEPMVLLPALLLLPLTSETPTLLRLAQCR